MTQTVSSQAFWDYGPLAEKYDLRPDYDNSLVHATLQAVDLTSGALAVVVGAGTGKLTGLLLDQGLDVIAIEPNAAMRKIASAKKPMRAARWLAANGEALPLRENCADLVAYGSSFNVLDTQLALEECARVLHTGGVWLALWNHRDLQDPLQRAVEQTIQRHVADYDYGRRRQSPAVAVSLHGGFGGVTACEQRFLVQMPAHDWLEAWRSHATLQRQAGDKLAHILREIAALLAGERIVRVPYHTRLWWARRVAR